MAHIVATAPEHLTTAILRIVTTRQLYSRTLAPECRFHYYFNFYFNFWIQNYHHCVSYGIFTHRNSHFTATDVVFSVVFCFVYCNQILHEIYDQQQSGFVSIYFLFHNFRSVVFWFRLNQENTRSKSRKNGTTCNFQFCLFYIFWFLGFEWISLALLICKRETVSRKIKTSTSNEDKRYAFNSIKWSVLSF